MNQSERDVSLGDNGTSGLIWCDIRLCIGVLVLLVWLVVSERGGGDDLRFFGLRSLGQTLASASDAGPDLGRRSSAHPPARGPAEARDLAP